MTKLPRNIFMILRILVVVLLITGASSSAQIIEHFESANEIYDLALQDQYIWCATGDGIVRWDTVTGDHIRFTTNDGLAENIVYSIAVTPDGVVWAGTKDALSRYDGESWMIWNNAAGTSFDTIISLAVDHDGALWVGSYNILARMKNDVWEIFPYSNIRDIEIGLDGSVWVVAWNLGPGRYKDGSWTFYSEDTLLHYKTEISVAPDGSVWIGPWEIYRFDGTSWSLVTRQQIDTFHAGTGNTAWGFNEGMKLFDNGVWKEISDPTWLTITQLLPGDGVIWCASDTGLYRFDEGVFTPLRIYDTPISNRGCDLSEGVDGSLWYGAMSGISRLQDGIWESWDEAHGLPESERMFVSEGPTGAVWAVSYVLNHLGDLYDTDYHLSRKMDDGWNSFTMPESIEYVTDIVVDDDGTPWISHMTGVSHFDGTVWTHYGQNMHYASSLFYDSIEDAVWCGGSSAFILKIMNGEEFTINFRFIRDSISCIRVHNDTLYVSDSGPVRMYTDDEWLPVTGGGTLFTFESDGRIVMLRENGGIERPIRITSQRVALSNSIRAIKGFEFGSESALWIACGWGAVYRVTDIPEPEFITLNGRVTEDDQPVAGAIVDFSPGGYSAITGTDGIYSIDVEPYRYDITFEIPSTYLQEILFYTTASYWVKYGDVKGPDMTLKYGVGLDEELPQTFYLSPPHPNPFNPATTIDFILPEPMDVQLTVYTISGQRVATLVDGFLNAGKHSAVFNATGLASGMYFYRLESTGFARTGKMLLVK